MSEPLYINNGTKGFVLEKELRSEYGKTPKARPSVSVVLPAALNADNGTAKVNLGKLVTNATLERAKTMFGDELVSKLMESPVPIELSALEGKDQQYLGLEDVEAVLAADTSHYEGRASEGEIEAMQNRVESGETYLLHNIKEDDEADEESDE